MKVVVLSLKDHMECQHGKIISKTREVEIGGGYLYILLPPVAEDGDMPGDRLSSSIA